MNLFWRAYGGGPRIAVVQNMLSSDGCQLCAPADAEILSIAREEKRFCSDGYCASFAANERAFFCLHTNDIVTIDEHGLMYLLFDATENDATIFVTGHCNSNCIMCPSSDRERMESDGLPAAWMKEYIRLLPQKIGHLVVTGGEPTLQPDRFFQIMHALADKFPETETLLLTNGRSFASQYMVDRLLAHCPPYLQVAIPLHAASADLHDRITRVAGSFAQTVAGIQHLLAENVAVEIRVVVSRLNYLSLEQIAAYIACNFPGTAVVHFIGLETRGNCAKNFGQLYLDPHAPVEHILPAIEILTKAGIDAAMYNFPLCAVPRGYWTVCEKSISPEKVRFMPACDSCSAKSLCGGFFRTTLSMAKPTVSPILF